MKAYYIVRMKGKQQFWFAGPYAHKEQAEAKQPLLNDVSVDDCPGEFITQRNYDNGNGFVRIAISFEDRKTWYGDCQNELISKNLF